jgi:hypothetical protein
MMKSLTHPRVMRDQVATESEYVSMAAPLVPAVPLTMQQVVQFLRDNMHIDVSVEPVPYEHGWTTVKVAVRLDRDVIAVGSDTYRT